MRSVAALLLTFAAGCNSFGPASERTLAAVRPLPLASAIGGLAVDGGRFELELESAALAGVFDAVFVCRDGELRLQLFPDVGGKVLDVTVGRDRVEASTPNDSYLAEAPLDAAEPHLALVLAVTMAELMAPVDARRVLGERRRGDDGIEVLLRPALGSGRVMLRFDDQGRARGYRFVLGWLDWTLADDGSLAGRGFAGRLCP